MKLGWIIGGVALLLLGVVVLSTLRVGPPDAPTHRTRPEKLAAVTLPDDLPRLGILEPRGNESPAPAYDRVLALYQQHRTALQANEPPAELVAELATLLVGAATAGGDAPGFLDKHLALRPAAEPSFGDALEGAASVALAAAQRRWEAGEHRAAAELVAAVWSLGERAFRENVRLYPRVQGLSMIARAGITLYGWLPEAPVEESTLRAWGAAVDRIDTAWSDKLLIVRGAQPPIGDLIEIARHDGDRTFRVEAMLQIGVMQHGPVSEANRRAMRSVVEEGRGDADPLVAGAAEAAAAFTPEQMRRVR